MQVNAGDGRHQAPCPLSAASCGIVRPRETAAPPGLAIPLMRRAKRAKSARAAAFASPIIPMPCRHQRGGIFDAAAVAEKCSQRFFGQLGIALVFAGARMLSVPINGASIKRYGVICVMMA